MPGGQLEPEIPDTPRLKCGRGLAPDSGVSVSIFLTDPPPSGASPLPHLTEYRLEIRSGHRAEVDEPVRGLNNTTDTMWEGACPRLRWVS
ncbi:hypothetical protein C4J90_1021 [Pseudomonas sp. R2-60-08W]|nr:hypothetical protein C4J90_1021 [Pseudomonas sp. R2-60-08W]